MPFPHRPELSLTYTGSPPASSAINSAPDEDERLNAKLRNLGVSPPPDPSALVVQNSLNTEVIAAIRRLTPKDREIVMLHTWEDLSREVIADLMGMTKGAIDQRIHRSYRRLARALAPTLANSTIQPPPIAEEGGTRRSTRSIAWFDRPTLCPM